MNVSMSTCPPPILLVLALSVCPIPEQAAAQIRLSGGGAIVDPGDQTSTEPAIQPSEPAIRLSVPAIQQTQPAMRPCVLLKNGNVLFGEAQQLGEFIIIRTGPDDQLKLPRTQVACWAKSLADLYRYRLDHRSSSNLETHLVDANWCLQYELYELAEQELQAAKQLAPNHGEVRLLEGRLKRRTRPVSAEVGSDAKVATTQFLNPSPSADDGDANRIDPKMLEGFARHVQPVLINKCGRCHSQTSDRQWRLTMPTTGTRPTAQLTRENLTAAVRFLDRSHPDQSPLLIKGTSPHGGGGAPLTARNAKAIESLRQWLMLASRSVEQPRIGKADRPTRSERTDPSKPIASVAQVAYTSERTVGPATDAIHTDAIHADAIHTDAIHTAQPIGPASALEGSHQTAIGSASGKPSDQPKRLPTVANPFDPSLFNRRFHRESE